MTVKISNSEKAKQLYMDCDNTDPNMHTLLTFDYFGRFKMGFKPMLIGTMINRYAIEQFEDDWIPFNRETFYINKSDKEGWKGFKSTLYRLEKKGYIETKFDNNQTYIRLIHDDLFNSEIYRRR